MPFWDDEKPPPSPCEGGVIVEVISGNDLYPNGFPLLLLSLKELGMVLALKLIIFQLSQLLVSLLYLLS